MLLLCQESLRSAACRSTCSTKADIVVDYSGRLRLFLRARLTTNLHRIPEAGCALEATKSSVKPKISGRIFWFNHIPVRAASQLLHAGPRSLTRKIRVHVYGTRTAGLYTRTLLKCPEHLKFRASIQAEYLEWDRSTDRALARELRAASLVVYILYSRLLLSTNPSNVYR